MANDDLGLGAVMIEPPRPEEDAASDYTQHVEAQQRAVEDQDWADLIGPPSDTTPDNAPDLSGAFAGAEPRTPEQASSNLSKVRSGAVSVISDIGKGLIESPSQIVGGVADAFGEAGQLLGEITGIGGVQFFDKNEDGSLGDFNPQYLNFDEFQDAGGDSLINAISTDPADSVTGGFVRSTAQFLTGFIPALKGVKGAGITGNIASSMAAGSIADMVVFDPHEDRLSTFLNEIPALEPYVSDYLADSNPENESSWEGRMKNAIEGAGLGITTEAAGALFRAFKYYKVQRAQGANFAPEPPSVQAQAGRDALKDAARDELVHDIPDAAFAPLGKIDGPLLTRLDPADASVSKIEAYLRGIDAEERAAKSVETANALSRINQAAEGAKARLGADTPADGLDAMLDGLRSGKTASVGPKNPVTRIIKSLGGIDPKSGFAAELRNLGVTSRTHPGIFRKGGLSNLDNIPVSEQPIFSAKGLDDGNGYIPEQAFLDAMQDEIAGDAWRSLDEQQRFAEEVAPLEALDEELSNLGLNPNEMSNATIRQRLEEIAQEQDALSREFAPRDGSDDVGVPKSETNQEFEEYRMEHTAPVRDEGNSNLSNLEETFPDIYSANGQRYYGTGDGAMDSKTMEVINAMRDNPEGLVTIYRAIPADLKNVSIQSGDWVTINRDYAIQHGEYFDAAKILEDQVPASQIWNDGNSIHEWGWDGPKKYSEAGPSSRATLDDVLDNEMPDRARPEAQGAAAPEGKVYINHARINSPDDVKAVLQEMADLDADAIVDKSRGVVSNEQTIKESSQEYRELDDLIGRPPGPMSASQAVAARRLLVSSGEQIVELAKRASAPNATPADLYNFRRSMAVHYSIQSEVMAARTETARALQSWSIPTGSSPARSKAVNELIMMNGGSGDLQSMAKAVSSVADNPTGLNAMTRELGRGRFGKALYQVWVNGILSGVKTHVVNITSNTATAVWAVPERMMASGISKAFYNGEIDTAEVAALAFGFTKGARDGIRMIYHGANAGDVADLSTQFDALGRPEVHTGAISSEAFGLDAAGPFGRAIDFIGKGINLPGLALQGEDKLFKSIGYRMELNALAHRMAISEGLDGEDFAKRYAEILADPPPNVMAEAVDYASVQTFTNKLGPIGQKGMAFIRSVPGGRLVMPFVQTPTNIVKYAFARTPLAYASGALRADIRAGGARAAQAHARVATGSMLMLAVADMTLEGTITGGGPTDPGVRRAWLADGNVPYSVKIGDRNYGYSRLDPIGLMIGLSADIALISNQAKEGESAEIVTAAVTALASNLASKTYLRGIFDFVGAIDPHNPQKSSSNYLQNFGGSLMPYSSFIRGIAQGVDPIMRDTKTVIRGDDGKADGVATFLQNMINKARAGIPGMSDDLPARRDIFGEEIDRSSGLGLAYDFASPIASRIDENDPVIKVIVDNRISISSPKRVIGGVELTAEQYSEYSRLSGQPLKEHLDKLVSSSGFQRLSNGPDGMKAEIIKDAVYTFRERAKGRMMREYPELQRLSYMRELERAQTLQGEN